MQQVRSEAGLLEKEVPVSNQQDHDGGACLDPGYTPPMLTIFAWVGDSGKAYISVPSPEENIYRA